MTRKKSNNFLCRDKVVRLLKDAKITRNDLAFEFGKELRTINGWFQTTNQHPITDADANKLASMLKVEFADIVGEDGIMSLNDGAIKFWDERKKETYNRRLLMKKLLNELGYEIPYQSHCYLSADSDDPAAMYLDLLVQAVRDAHTQYLEVMQAERLNEMYNNGLRLQKRP